MDEATRHTLVFLIIGAVLIVAIPALAILLRKRRREKLRRRGIKRYGH